MWTTSFLEIAQTFISQPANENVFGTRSWSHILGNNYGSGVLFEVSVIVLIIFIMRSLFSQFISETEITFTVTLILNFCDKTYILTDSIF